MPLEPFTAFFFQPRNFYAFVVEIHGLWRWTPAVLNGYRPLKKYMQQPSFCTDEAQTNSTLHPQGLEQGALRPEKIDIKNRYQLRKQSSIEH